MMEEVNAKGKRVANESPYNQMFFNKQMLRQASPAYYAIYEPSMMPDYFKADADRLAAKMNVNYEALRASLDRYNELCKNGEDVDFGKDKSHLIAYSENGPLYAVRVYAASWGTIGGAVTSVIITLGASLLDFTPPQDMLQVKRLLERLMVSNKKLAGITLIPVLFCSKRQ